MNVENNQLDISSRATFIIVALLVFLSLIAISARNWYQQDNDLPNGDSAWEISVTHQVTADKKGASLSISPPWDTQYSRLFAQSLSHTGMRQKRTKSNANKREIVLITPDSGDYITQAVFKVHISSLARSELKKLKLSEHNRSQWLSESDGVSINTAATAKIIDRISTLSSTSSELINHLFGYVSNNIRINYHSGSDSERAITERKATALGSSRALIALLRSAHLPARLVTGLNLQVTVDENPYYWVEVYDEEVWIPLDPVHGHMRQLPAYYVPLRKGGSEAVEADKASVTSTSWVINTILTPDEFQSSDSKSLAVILDLNRLSPAERENLGILLLLPLGILATEILRQLLGIRTYGTFTPTLLALAVIHVDRMTAMIIFVLVTVIGISIRSFLPNLQLQRTPLLAIVFTLVAISMTFVVSGFMYLDPGMDGVVVLLPVVVLTMLVDRIYSVSDQRGMRTAIIRLFWTIVSALVSLLVLLQVEWSYWLVSYPELHAITLAGIIFIGRCNGIKISALPILSWLHEPVYKRVVKKRKKAQPPQSGDSL